NPLDFDPDSVGGLTGTNNNTNFLVRGAGLTIAGLVSGLGGNTANVTLTLLSDLSILPRNIATNGSGSYTFSECYLNGDYRIVAASPISVNGAGTQITVIVPPGAVTGAITLSKTGCTNVTTASFTIVTGYESDVAPRGAVDGLVKMDDWTQVGRFIAAFDTVS